MKSWSQFVAELDEGDLIQCVLDGRVLSETGFIEVCVLRRIAGAWSKNVNSGVSVASAMAQVENYANSYFANKYLTSIGVK